MRQPSAYENLGPHKNRAIWCGCRIVNEDNELSGREGDNYIKFCDEHWKAVPSRFVVPPDANPAIYGASV